MKTTQSIFALIAILFISSLPAYAQKATGENEELIIDEKELIWSKYDKTNNETLVSTYSIGVLLYYGWPNSRVCSPEEVAVTAAFFHKGKTLDSTPINIELLIKSKMTGRAKFKKEKNRNLTIIADKKKINLGEMKLISSSSESITSRMRRNEQEVTCFVYDEEIAIHIPFESFKKIFNSKKVNIKISNLSIKMKKSDIQVFQNLLKRMQK